jgi:hypothetical protein
MLAFHQHFNINLAAKAAFTITNFLFFSGKDNQKILICIHISPL